MSTCIIVSLVLLSFLLGVPGCPPFQTSTHIAYSRVCGVYNQFWKPGNRVVGGQDASKNEYPWMVALVKNMRVYCGGTLISSRTVLTAAHCHNDSAMVYVGDHDKSILSDGEQLIKPQRFTKHREYVEGRGEFDFAIIQLPKEVIFSKSITPICLPTPDTNYDNEDATVIGWGRTEYQGNSSNILQEVNLHTIPNRVCRLKWSSVTDNQICAIRKGKGSCHGDSGGPLMTKEDNKYFSVIGVVSYGHKCGETGYPDVYARVTAQLKWINENTWGSTLPKPTDRLSTASEP